MDTYENGAKAVSRPTTAADGASLGRVLSRIREASNLVFSATQRATNIANSLNGTAEPRGPSGNPLDAGMERSVVRQFDDAVDALHNDLQVLHGALDRIDSGIGVMP